LVKILYSKHYFSPLNNFMRKGKDPDPYLGSGSGRTKNMGILRIRIPNTGNSLGLPKKTSIGFLCLINVLKTFSDNLQKFTNTASDTRQIQNWNFETDMYLQLR
jgi:hypothetical protein